ncbi:non-ribosomal peptide synthase/polyketide synthase [Bradyrhizobium sp. HKCCYLRH3099]|uniref:non-ribosomal peptide synthase/polyketide synthase n=1 Tax=unclassified Bradyrhizobium TaxID=2631580 RepID=UPI003EBC020C
MNDRWDPSRAESERLPPEDNPIGSAVAVDTDELQRKRKLAAELLRRRGAEAAHHPLSFGQQALWFLHQLDPSSTAYHVAFPVRLRGPVDVAALRLALQDVAARHPALRTTFAWRAGTPMQAVSSRAVELRHVQVADESALRQTVQAAYDEPFDFEHGPLFRAVLISRGSDDHVLLPLAHHIVIDGQSIVILLDEIGRSYQARAAGTIAELPSVERSYTDFVRWQRALLAGARGEQLWSYWHWLLSGELPVLDLPLDHPRPAQRRERGEQIDLTVAPELLSQLKALARRHETTLSVVLLAAYSLLLHRLSGQDDILLGSVVSGRTQASFEATVGYFANTVVHRTRLTDGQSLAAFLDATRRATAEAAEHQDYPFSLLAQRLQTRRDPARTPIYQACFNFLQLRGQQAVEGLIAPLPNDGWSIWGGLAARSDPFPQQLGQFDFVLELYEANAALFGNFKFNPDLFAPATVRHWARAFETLLRAFAADPVGPAARLALVPSDLAQAEQPGAPACVTEIASQETLAGRFAAQANRTPDVIAIRAGHRTLTYRDLDRRANALAHELMAAGVRPRDRVALLFACSPEFVIAVLAALKAGATYVPLEPGQPRDRRDFILFDTGARFAVAAPALAAELAGQAGVSVLLPRPDAVDDRAPEIAGAADDLAYIMFTSGSTGRPKGVGITHRNIISLADDPIWHSGQAQTILLHSNPAFDASTFELFAPLLHGHSVAIGPTGAFDAGRLAAAIRHHGVTRLFLTYQLFAAVAEEQPGCFDGVDEVLTGGETVSPEVVRRVLDHSRTVVGHMYGPTETTTFVTRHPLPDVAAITTPLPLGRSVANRAVVILDDALNLLPIGVVGEVYVAGAGLARGYINRPGLTAERFIADPFGPTGTRLYRTGDRARWRADGTLEFHGRADHQVKIRGFRIEPGEIESALRRHEAVAATAVVPQEHAQGRRLVAYVVGRDGAAPSAAELRGHLGSLLPDYMVPALFVALEALPVTPNGKLDRKALPEPDLAAASEASYRAPRSATEQALAAIWAELLGHARIGIDDNFFELGGHSLLATRLVSRLRTQFGRELPLRRLFEQPTIARLAASLDDKTDDQATAFVALPRPADLPLSAAQTRLWFLDQLEGGSAAYLIPFALDLDGALDAPALDGALTTLMARHESLRSTVELKADAPIQIIRPASAFRLLHDDLSDLAPADRDAALATRLDGLVQNRFDLSRDLPLHAVLVRLGPERHVLAVVIHHIAFDGWSSGVFFGELARLYEAARSGAVAQLPELSVQYADYALWHRQLLADPNGPIPRELAYWRTALTDAPARLELPLDLPRPTTPRHPAGFIHLHHDASEVAAWEGLARRHGVTLFMVLHAAFATVLARWSGSDDISIGTPIANRTRREFEGLIGFFVNTLVLRLRLADDPTLAELLARVRETDLAAFAHQTLPFEQLVEELQPARQLGVSPLFQAMLALQNAAAFRAPEIAGLTTRMHPPEPGVAKFALTLSLQPTGDGGLEGILEYDAEMFAPASMERLAGHVATLLGAMAKAEGTARLSSLSMLGAAERRQLQAWNATSAQRAPDETILDLLDAAARDHAHRPAIVHAGGKISYTELHRRADHLAGHLAARITSANALIGIALGRGPELIVAILAVLKAGHAYVPLDPAYPAERLRVMAEDARLQLVLTDGSTAALPADLTQLRLDDPALLQPPPAVSRRRPRPDDLAYVIFTSGSTGRPKGVAIPQRGLVNLVRWSFAAVGTDVLASTFASSSINFDMSVLEMFSPLSCGGCIEVAPDLLAIAHRGRSGMRLLSGVPSVLRTLLDTTALPTDARALILAGEALPEELVHRTRQVLPDCRIWNLYGPTEASVYSTAWFSDGPDDAPPTIGRPVHNMQVHLLDERLALVPIGVVGEVYVAGAGLARGYINRPGLTAERFIADPFGPPGTRLYRTGDRARWRADGTLEFLGRADHQVKIRGFRIEPGEIESALRRHEAIAAAAVVPQEHAQGRRLVAYVVGRDGVAPSAAELRGHLGSLLPDYMVPALFVALDALPVTPNGKLDRNALPEPDLAAASEAGYRAPRSATEQALAAIWAELLGHARIGIDDNFFELGGHSLLATRLVSRLRTQFGRELPLRRLFEQPTIARLAASLDDKTDDQATAFVALPRLADLPLSAAQTRLWFLDQLEGGSAAYLIPFALDLDGALDAQALDRALTALVARHESLRSTVELKADAPIQIIRPASAFRLLHDDLSDLAPADRDAALAARLDGLVQHRFDLSRDLPLHAVLVRLAAERHVLAVVIHHIAFDGWSSGVFFGELARLYEAARNGAVAQLPELSVQYADYALWHRQLLADPNGPIPRELAFWRTALADAPARLELPLDLPRPSTPRHPAGFVHLRHDASEVAAWEALARRHGATLFMVLHAAFVTVLARWSGSDDISIGTPIANRTRREFEGLIGFFVNTLVLRLRLSDDPTLAELLARVRETDLAAFAHQTLPFEQLVEELQPARQLGVSPLFQAMLALQNAAAFRAPEIAGLTTRMHPPEPGVAKFALTLSLQPTGDGGLEGILEYDAEMFAHASMQRLAGHVAALLGAMAKAEGTARLSSLSMLGAAEQRQLQAWNATSAQRAPDETILDLLDAAARDHAHRPAIVHAGGEISYTELHRRADHLAGHLAARITSANALIGIALGRGPELIVAILAVLKAGHAYVPLDPAYPAERLRVMAEDARLQLVLTDGSTAALPGDLTQLRIDDPALLQQPHELPQQRPRPDDLAYVIFTSGSTGRPKGVAIPQRGLVNLVHAQTAAFDIKAGDRVLQFASPSFDASVSEIATALAKGAAIVTGDADTLRPGASLSALVRSCGVTHATLPPTALRVMEPADVAGCRVLVVAGEACPGELVALWSPGRRMLNAYGPTEVSVCATISAPLSGDAPPPMGAPIDNARIHLLDPQLNEVAIGVEGEVYVAGAGVARGYLNRPGLTAERFIADPFGSPGTRLYRTGDRARRHADGTLEFLGRADHQVKIRGFRIEPGEIESALRRHDGVSAVAVVAQEHGQGQRLVAYVVGRDGVAPATAELRSHLAALLPDYMVPALFVALDALPLTPNGKLDRKALPEPDLAAAAEASYRAPRSATEQALATIWAELLGTDKIGIDDNFFELGGDSITSIQMVTRARRAGLVLTPRDVFQQGTIAKLATITAPKQADTDDDADGGTVPLTPIMRWLLDRGTDLARFSQSMTVRLPRGLTLPQLIGLIDAAIARHAMLRSRLAFDPIDGAASLQIAPVDPALTRRCLRQIDISTLTAEQRAQRISQEIGAAEARLEPTAGVMLQAVHFTAAGTDHDALLLVLHHLAVDGVSWRILIEELAASWKAAAAGQPAQLPALGTSFGQWSRRLHARSQHPSVLAELPHWQRTLAASAAPPQLTPPAQPLPGGMQHLTLTLPASVTARIMSDAPRRLGARVLDILLAAFVLALSDHDAMRPQTVVIDLEGHGRNEFDPAIDLSRTVGWFTSLYPVRFDLPAADADGEGLLGALRAVQAGLADVPDDGLGFGLLRYLNEDSAQTLARLPAPKVGFNYLGRFATDHVADWSIIPTALPADLVEQSDLRPAHAVELNTVAIGQGADARLSATWSSDRSVVDDGFARRLATRWFALLERFAELTLATPLPRSDAARTVPIRQVRLAPLQRGLLYEHLADPGRTDVYVVQLEVAFEGELDRDRLRGAVAALLARHDNLRAAFHADGSHGFVQRIAPSVELPWRERMVDAGEDVAAVVDRVRQDDLAQRFDLAAPPLLRGSLISAVTNHVLILTLHHILIDGWSMPIVLRDLMQLYHGNTAQPAAVPFSRYLDWLDRQDRGAALTAWRDAFEDWSGPLLVAPQLTGHADATQTDVTLGDNETRRLVATARALGVTLATLVQGAWALWLGARTRRDDVVFGITVAGRDAALDGSDQIVGLLANTLPLRVKLSPAITIRTFLADLQNRQASLLAHQHLSLGEIQQQLGTDTLFDTLLAFENYPVSAAAIGDSGALRVTRVQGRDANHYPLSLAVLPGARLTLRLHARPDLFGGTPAAALIAELRGLLNAMADDGDARLGRVVTAHLRPDPRLTAWNATATPEPTGHLLASFVRHAQAAPTAPALIWRGETIDYARLEAMSGALAAQLVARGIGADDLVALHLPRSPELLVAILGVLRIGAAYLPIDPSLPRERVSYMLDDACPALAIVADTSVALPTPVPVLAIDPGTMDAAPSLRQPHPLQAAYLLYTSGTTGRPKGVTVTCRGLQNLLAAVQSELQLQPSDRFAATTTASFDISIVELLLPLVTGGCVVLAAEDEATAPDRLAALIGAAGVTALQATPTVLNLLTASVPSAFAGLKVLSAGEALTEPTLQRLTACGVASVHNYYGPTETTIYSTMMRFSGADSGRPPIGRPIANTVIRVLDDWLAEVPVGVEGEIYIGGVGLARGYCNRAGLTAERFIADPLGAPGARLYRTGDRGRWREDGVLECFGRVDHQIKLRGLRIEPGEIEHALQRHPDIADACVMVRETRGHAQLVAYVVPRQKDRLATLDEMRSHLIKLLPDYMVPSRIIDLPALPRSRSGKIDRAALPWTDADVTDVARRAPGTVVERLLADIWASVLDQDPLGIDDDFFALGGDSILAIQVVMRARQAGLVFSARDIFRLPTVARLAAFLQQQPAPAATASAGASPQQSAEDEVELTPLQLGLLRHSLDDDAPDAYRMQTVLIIEGHLDAAVLHDAWTSVVARHEVLRTVISERHGRYVMLIRNQVDAPWETRDLSAHDEPEQALRHVLADDLQTPFRFDGGNLLRVMLLRLAPDRHALVLSNHHVLLDGWSLSLVLEDLFAARAALAAGRTDILPSRAPFSDFVRWLARQDREQSARFWHQHLADTAPMARLSLPTPPQGRGQRTLKRTIDRDRTAALRRAARQDRISANTLLQAAWAVMLSRLTSSADVVFGTTIALRPPEIEGIARMAGLLINTVPARIRLVTEARTAEWLAQIQAGHAERMGHADAGLADIIRSTGRPDRELFETLMVFENLPAAAIDGTVDELSIHVLPVDQHTHYPLAVAVMPGDVYELAFSYDAGRFAADDMARLADGLVDIIDRLVTADRDAPLQRLLGADAKDLQQIAAWNATAAPTAVADETLADLLEQTAREHADAPALIGDFGRVTYRQLHEAADRLAGRMHDDGARSGEFVGIACSDRARFVIAALAALKAGLAYVPLDAAYPRDRLAFIVADSKVQRMLTDSAAAWLPPSVRRISMDDLAAGTDGAPRHPRPAIGPDDLAYVIYTSGSTGRPKGVMVTHRGAANLVRAQRAVFGAGPGDRVLQFASPNFDASVWEICMALGGGAALVVGSSEDLLPGDALASLVRRHAVSHATLPHSALSVMAPSDLDGCRVLVVAGEACPAETARLWAPGRTFINGYGPTETTVCASISAPLSGDRPPPIGCPILGLRCHVLDDRLDPVPIGVAGELYVAGRGLARGYLDRPGLTAERFIADPWGAPGDRLYRTGDRVRWLPDGNLDFLGRADAQIKLRGFRIEPGEIEEVLRRHEAVAAAAIGLDNTSGDQRLVCWWSAKNGADATPTELRRHLAEHLPAYMVPAQFIRLDRLPLNPAGKIDRQALAAIGGSETDARIIAPRDAIEFTLQSIWQELLRTAPIGVTTSLFEIGGDSLILIQLIARCRSEFGLKLRAADIAADPTIEGMARLLRSTAPAQPAKALVTLRAAGEAPPLFCIHPATGTVFCYLEIVSRLSIARPVYGLQDVTGRDGAAPASLVDQSRSYLQEIRRVQPHGPYHLLGWSYGGVVAFEIARQLVAAGETVASLLLLDAPVEPEGGWEVSTAEIIADLAGQNSDGTALDYTKAADVLSRSGEFPPDITAAQVEEIVQSYVRCGRLLAGYQLAPYIGDATFFHARQRGNPAAPPGWRALIAGAFELIELECDHDGLMRGPFAARVAQSVDQS